MKQGPKFTRRQTLGIGTALMGSTALGLSWPVNAASGKTVSPPLAKYILNSDETGESNHHLKKDTRIRFYVSCATIPGKKLLRLMKSW